MFEKNDYITRGYNFIHNRIFPQGKRLSSLMIYATDLCDSGCKHCLIWAKRPPVYLSVDSIRRIMKSKCVHPSTMVGLEGGEFLLHPQADEIMEWFYNHHRNFDIFSNCLKPDRLIQAVKRYKPHRLYISLDGNEETYRYMRGKDGYNDVLKVISSLKNEVPVFVMFTLSPFNDYGDLQHVAELCKEYGVFLRVGIYNNIPFFDTIEDAKEVVFGASKNQELLKFSEVKELQGKKKTEITRIAEPAQSEEVVSDNQNIPQVIREFKENYDYVSLYKSWRSGNLRLTCNSILDSLIVLPDGSVPICQNLDLKLGNIHQKSLDEIFNSPESAKTQKHYSGNCNQCWISYHRKYDIVLYRTFEKYFGRSATSKLLGYYKWDADDSVRYEDAVR